MEYALELQGVTKRYQDFSLENMDLRLPRGCILGFVGENGAGKSTTIKLILDMVHKESGEITILGKDHKEFIRSEKEKIGVVLDQCCFPDQLTVAEISKIMRHIYRCWDPQLFQHYMREFALPERKKVKELSKGMKMKLSIAVAMCHGAELLIMDEPTSGLDPIVREEILDIFLDFMQDESHSIFVSSHIISDLEKICDYIAFLHKGRMIFTENKDILLEEYGILHCSEKELSEIDKALVKGVRRHGFGVDALVLRRELQEKYVVDPAGIEDIMLYYVKGE